jgi:cellulose synthase operon protein YhjQ
MTVIALISVQGGAGASTLCASLSSLASLDGFDSLAVELDSQNSLALHLGSEELPARGWSTVAADPSGFDGALLECSNGCLVLPHGRPAPGPHPVSRDEVCRWVLERGQRRRARSWTFLDLPGLQLRSSSAALRAADAVVAVLRPDLLSLHLLGDLLHRCSTKPVAAIVNGFDPRQRLQVAALQMLSARLGQALCPQVIHHDVAVAEALAHRSIVVESAPYSQAAHDLTQAWRWLQWWWWALPELHMAAAPQGVPG